MAGMVNDSGNAVMLSPDGSPVRPSKIPDEFSLVMTQEMKEWREILRETMFKFHCSL